MASRDEQDLLAVFALGEVPSAWGVAWAAMKSPSAGVRGPQTSTVGCMSKTGEARTGRPDVDGLPALDVDVVDSELLEKGQAAVHRVVGVLSKESRERQQWKVRRNRQPPPKVNDVYGRPQHPRRIQKVANIRTQVLPDGVVVDRAKLFQLALGLGSGRLRPRRGSHTINKRSAGREVVDAEVRKVGLTGGDSGAWLFSLAKAMYVATKAVEITERRDRKTRV
jgi:hypothetical protein